MISPDWDALLEFVFQERTPSSDSLYIMILVLAERVASIERRLSMEPEPIAEFSITVPAAAARLRVCPQRVFQLIKAGRLRSKMVGGRRLISAASLDAHMEMIDRR